MPREQKVGLTMIIMIVGFAGAFCFRKPTEDQAAPPELRREGMINEQIAEFRTRPYLPGLDHQREQAAPAQDDPLRQQLAAWNLEAERDPQTPVPAPIGMLIPVDSPRSSRPMARPTPTPPAPMQTVSRDEPSVPEPQEPATATHTVQPGETLSGIAYKYYGSASKYLALYELNRDVLSSPNDLRPGMTLKIPTKSTRASQSEEVREAKTPPAPQVSQENTAQSRFIVDAWQEPETNREAEPAENMFVPARSNPFNQARGESPYWGTPTYR